MSLANKIKTLEKKKIVSKSPNPIIPFTLTFIALILTGIAPSNLKVTIYVFTIFSMIFSVAHLIIVKVLERKLKFKPIGLSY
ncbi:MAG: hypothetical protein WCX73_01455 [Candidatus Pacearchaeota archaeon]|jgi:hypothetical protein